MKVAQGICVMILLIVVAMAIPHIVVGAAWLATFGGFDYVTSARSTLFIIAEGILILIAIILGIVNIMEEI